MGIFDRLLGKGRVEVSAATLRDAVRAAAAAVGAGPVVPALVTARIADRVRAAKGDPMDPDRWDAVGFTLDPEAWQRVAIAGEALAVMPAEALAAPGSLAQTACLQVASRNPLLTTAVLLATPLRCEEFARKLARQCGVAIVGEDDRASDAAIERLDYPRLLAEGERAAKEAQERLKALEERRAAQGPRRGKW